MTNTDRLEQIEQREAHVETLLSLGRLVVSQVRPGVDESWFVLLTGLDTDTQVVVRVDA